MTNHDLYTYCKFIMNKRQLGDIASPGDFNAILAMVNVEMLNRQWDVFMSSMASRNQHIKLSSIGLDVFYKKLDNPTVLPDDFAYPLWVNANVDGVLLQGDVRYSHDMFTEALNVMSDIKSRPIMVIAGKEIIGVYPQADSFTVHYLRLPIAPFADYCFNELTLEPVYMPSGSILANNVLTLQGVLISNDCTHPIYGANHQSLTQESEWTNYDLLSSLIIEKMSLNSKDQMNVQFSQSKQQTP